MVIRLGKSKKELAKAHGNVELEWAEDAQGGRNWSRKSEIA